MVYNAIGMDWGSLNDWGSLASMIGFPAAVLGLAAAIWVALKATSATRAAEEATRTTREQMSRMLTAADVEQAIALIDKMKAHHRDAKWELSLQLYPILRRRLVEIRDRHPELRAERHRSITAAVAQMTVTEDTVGKAMSGGIVPRQPERINRSLNAIQNDLEGLVGPLQSVGITG